MLGRASCPGSSGAAAWTSFCTRRGAGEAVGEAGGVAHQVLDGDRPLERGRDRACRRSRRRPSSRRRRGCIWRADRKSAAALPRPASSPRPRRSAWSWNRCGRSRRRASAARRACSAPSVCAKATLPCRATSIDDARRAARRDLALHRRGRAVAAPARERPISSGRAVGRPEGAVEGACIGTSSRRSKRAHHVRNRRARGKAGLASRTAGHS